MQTDLLLDGVDIDDIADMVIEFEMRGEREQRAFIEYLKQVLPEALAEAR